MEELNNYLVLHNFSCVPVADVVKMLEEQVPYSWGIVVGIVGTLFVFGMVALIALEVNR